MGQCKGGFYPVPPEAVQFLSQFVKPPGGRFAILDPCAGRGAAIKQWADLLGCQPADVYAIELEEGRAAACRESLPASNVLAPCSFFGTGISACSFSFVFANPPYDDELGGGGRVEQSFLVRALQLVKARGVLALACPERVSLKHELQTQIMTWFEDVCVIPYPDAHRAFAEVVIFARKLARPRQGQLCRWSEVCSQEPLEYEVPSSCGPRRFEKTELTAAEKAQALACSPLRRLLEPPAEPPLPEPGLPLTHGQLALVLASGHLNGVVAKPGEAPHVIRGVAAKENYLAGVQEEETGKGTKTVSTYSQRIVLTVRALCPDGAIKDFA